MVREIFYRMWLIFKSIVLHPLSATIIDFETGEITVEAPDA